MSEAVRGAETRDSLREEADGGAARSAGALAREAAGRRRAGGGCTVRGGERVRALARKATQRPPQRLPSPGTTSERSQNRPGPHRG